MKAPKFKTDQINPRTWMKDVNKLNKSQSSKIGGKKEIIDKTCFSCKEFKPLGYLVERLFQNKKGKNKLYVCKDCYNIKEITNDY